MAFGLELSMWFMDKVGEDGFLVVGVDLVCRFGLWNWSVDLVCGLWCRSWFLVRGK